MSAVASTLSSDFLCAQLRPFVPESVARGIVRHALKAVESGRVRASAAGHANLLLYEMEKGIDLFVESGSRQVCKLRIRQVCADQCPETSRKAEPVTMAINDENDIVSARNRVRLLADLIGFSKTEQIKIATAVSELTRNIVKYAGKGEIEMCPLKDNAKGIKIVASDRGPGIPNLDHILSGAYRSKTGLGLGLIACKKLMTRFQIHTVSGHGTRITAEKDL
jgi:serine/threonine-protein kinase RsbT